MFFSEGLLLGGLGCLAEFTVDFVLVGVGHELVEPMVGPGEFDDLVGGQERDEAFLPVVVTAFDFTFGLGRWGIEPLDAVEVESRAELGEGVGGVGVEEGVEVQQGLPCRGSRATRRAGWRHIAREHRSRGPASV